MEPAAYIAACLPHALAEQATYGVPASVALAQGALESGWGESVLAVRGHNHHGIKAADTPGRVDNPHRLPGTIDKASGEYRDVWTVEVSAFLTFPDALAGHLGHGFFLAHRGLYGAAFAADTHVGFVRALAAAGYATDPGYADKVLNLIDTYRLTQYDRPRQQEPEEAPMRIVIMPSSQEHNACKVGDTEQAHTRLIAARTAELLRSAGHDARYIVAGDDSKTDSEQLVQMAAASNAVGADLHVDIHTDAGGATGPSVFYIGEGRSKALGQAIYAELKAAVPFAPNGVHERGTLYMLRKTTASAVLVECWPHDKLDQARWGHGNIDTVARAIARGVLNIAGGTLPAAPTPAPPTTTVQEDDMALTADDIYQITARAVREAATPTEGWPGATLSQVVSDLHRKVEGLEAKIDALATAGQTAPADVLVDVRTVAAAVAPLLTVTAEEA